MSRIYQYKAPKPRYSNNYSWPERLAAAGCYLPSLLGFFVGIVYILAKGPGCDGPFFRFNFYQGIFLNICMTLIGMIAQGMSGVLIGTLRLCEGLIGSGAVEFLSTNLILVTAILEAPLILLMPYGIIWSLRGKNAEIYFVSRVARNLLRG